MIKWPSFPQPWTPQIISKKTIALPIHRGSSSPITATDHQIYQYYHRSNYIYTHTRIRTLRSFKEQKSMCLQSESSTKAEKKPTNFQSIMANKFSYSCSVVVGWLLCRYFYIAVSIKLNDKAPHQWFCPVQGHTVI